MENWPEVKRINDLVSYEDGAVVSRIVQPALSNY
jgi:hypothetical protein